MFSVILALTVIFGISLVNLFLGFASALLIGRGPKSWSDLDGAVTVRFFSPRLVLARPRRGVEMVAVVPVPIEAAGETALVRDVTDVGGQEAATIMAVERNEPPVPPAHPAAWDPATQRLVLTPTQDPCPAEEGPPETVLESQFEAWRASERREDTPCLSGFMVTVNDPALDELVQASLMRALHTKIAGQLRKDRRVLRIADNQFVWFSADVDPADGLMPVERIRQLLDKTRFLHEDNAVAIAVQAAVVAAFAQDSPSDLIRRIQEALQFALEKGEASTCLDAGQGPSFVPPARLDLDETECVLE
jgi:hypothetical protein